MTPRIITVGIVIVMFLLWLYLYARYSLSVPAFVLDKTSITGALRRSAFLTGPATVAVP